MKSRTVHWYGCMPLLEFGHQISCDLADQRDIIFLIFESIYSGNDSENNCSYLYDVYKYIHNNSENPKVTKNEI